MSNVPKLRFSEFDGEWEEKKLGEIATFSKGKGISKSDIFEDGKIECIRYGELYTVYNEIISTIQSRTNVSQNNLVFSKYNDVIIPASGETQIDIATASCVLKNDVALSGDLNIIRMKENGVFLAYYLNSEKKLDIARLAQGISVVHLYSSQLKTLKLNVPSLTEQQKIANFLTSIDKKIELLESKITHLERYKKGLMQKIFSLELRFRGDDGEVFEDWSKTELKNIIEIVSNKFNPKTSNENKKCIELEHLSQGTGTLLNYKNSKGQESIKNIFKKNQILFGKLRPYLRKFWKTDFDGVCSSEIWVLNGLKISNSYLFQLVQTDKFNQIANISSGSKMPRADWKYMKEIPFLYPTLSEQQKIANFLSSIDKKIEQTQKALEEMKAFKKGLLQGMFV